MSGPQPHSNQWPYEENETTEIHADVHECKGLILRHQMPLYQSMARDKVWHTNTHDTALKCIKDYPETCEYVTQCMLDDPGTEISEAGYTRGTQSNAPMEKPTPNRP